MIDTDDNVVQFQRRSDLHRWFDPAVNFAKFYSGIDWTGIALSFVLWLAGVACIVATLIAVFSWADADSWILIIQKFGGAM